MTTTLDKWEGVVLNASTEVPPTLVLLEETIYPYAYIYAGPCEQFIFTFTTIPFTPASWVSGRLAAHCEDEVKKAGGRVMEMRVYVDEDPWRPWTNWRIEITGVPSTAAGLRMYAWWVGVILVILALIALIIVTYNFIIKPLTYQRNPALKDVKPGWDKETLISAIQDSEDYWKRTPTPIETLEAMSEGELRDYLDKIAEEEVPTKASIWPWVVGGAAIVGGIFLVAATRKKGGKRKKT